MNYCEVCAKTFSCHRSYETHLKSRSHRVRSEKTINLYKCFCGKAFNQTSSLSRHKKKCKQSQTNSDPPEQKLQLLQKENQQMREEMNELRKQVEMLLGKSTKNTTNNIQTLNSIENQNVNIVVNSFGHENIDHLTDQIICKLIKTAPFTSVPLLIEKIHFDPEHPENHNIKITNKKLNYAEVVKNNKWVTANKKKVIDDVIQKSYDLLDEKYTDNKDDISEKRQERFQNFQDKYEQADEELLRNIKNDVDLLLINGTS